MEIWQRNQNGLFPMNTKILSSITEYGLPDTCTLLVGLSTVGHYNSIFFFGSSKETTFMTISWDVAEKFIFKIYNIGNIFLYTLSNGIEFLEEISLSDIRWLKFHPVVKFPSPSTEYSKALLYYCMASTLRSHWSQYLNHPYGRHGP